MGKPGKHDVNTNGMISKAGSVQSDRCRLGQRRWYALKCTHLTWPKEPPSYQGRPVWPRVALQVLSLLQILQTGRTELSLAVCTHPQGLSEPCDLKGSVLMSVGHTISSLTRAGPHRHSYLASHKSETVVNSVCVHHRGLAAYENVISLSQTFFKAKEWSLSTL